MFFIRYREQTCRDCHEPNPRPICHCGYMRPLDDEWWIVPLGISWSGTRPPHVRLPRAQLEALRDAILNGEIDPYGVDAPHEAEMPLVLGVEYFGPHNWDGVEYVEIDTLVEGDASEDEDTYGG